MLITIYPECIDIAHNGQIFFIKSDRMYYIKNTGKLFKFVRSLSQYTITCVDFFYQNSKNVFLEDKL